MARAAAVPTDVTLYSNHPAAVYLNTGKPTASLPIAWNPTTRQPFVSYPCDVAALRSDVAAGRSVVVFDLAPTPDHMLSEAELRELLPPSAVHAEGGGRIYSRL
jgi:hypothetical protein